MNSILASKKYILAFVILTLILIVVAILSLPIFKINNSKAQVTNTTNNTAISGPKVAVTLNKEYSFPAVNDKNITAGKIKYILEGAELRDEIIVKGQKANATNGKIFLIINLKLKNDQNEKVQMNTRDFIRLSVNGNDKEWLAPEIHNDLVAIQAISTKFTRLGFPVNNSDHDFKLQVGEINGAKETVDIRFN